MEKELRDRIVELAKDLQDVPLKVITLRYGLDNDSGVGRSQEAVAYQLNMPIEIVRAIENVAMSKLRK